MRLLLYASGVERPARGVPVMVRAGPRVPAMGLQQRPKLDTQTYEMEKVEWTERNKMLVRRGYIKGRIALIDNGYNGIAQIE